jgi:hypothetical protein
VKSTRFDEIVAALQVGVALTRDAVKGDNPSLERASLACRITSVMSHACANMIESPDEATMLVTTILDVDGKEIDMPTSIDTLSALVSFCVENGRDLKLSLLSGTVAGVLKAAVAEAASEPKAERGGEPKAVRHQIAHAIKTLGTSKDSGVVN